MKCLLACSLYQAISCTKQCWFLQRRDMLFNLETFKVAMQILRNRANTTHYYRNPFCIRVPCSSNFYSQFRIVIYLLKFLLVIIIIIVIFISSSISISIPVYNVSMFRKLAPQGASVTYVALQVIKNYTGAIKKILRNLKTNADLRFT